MRPVTPGEQGGNATTNTTPSASIAAVTIEFPPHQVGQREALSGLTGFGGPQFDRFGESAGVQTRRISLPLPQYGKLSGFTEANDIYIETALELGERALLSAFDAAKVKPADIDIVFSTTVTGLAVPTLEARLATRVGLRPDVKRVPMFGLGCVAGAAGVARMHDYLLAFPDHVSVLLAVELCSLTLQRDDFSIANLVAASLFGDGVGAVVAKGSALAPMGPRVLATRSRLYPDTEEVMGWNIGRIDISTWVCHPGGPKVIEAIENTLDLPVDALDHTRNSLRNNANLSSVSVLDVLRANMADPPPPGSFGLMIAMGPGFCSELVLLGW
jgi:alkylresorcinol/alkylpyrone synthase